MALNWNPNEFAEIDVNPIKILFTRIHIANAINQSNFAYISQFYIEKPVTYANAIQKPNTPQ